MFDIGWSEILVVMVVALVVMGPQELPRALYHIGKWLRGIRSFTGEMQRHVDDVIRTVELDDLKKEAEQLSVTPPEQLARQMLDPQSELQRMLDDVNWSRTDLDSRARAGPRASQMSGLSPSPESAVSDATSVNAISENVTGGSLADAQRRD